MPSETPQPPASAVVWRGRPEADATTPISRARRRGVVRALFGLLLAALLALWKPILGAVAAAVALLLLAIALVSPRDLYPRIERGLAAFARAVGLAVTWTTLSLVHVFVFLPLGLLLRAAGRLRITRAPDPGAATYWRPADRPGRYERQF